MCSGSGNNSHNHNSLVLVALVVIFSLCIFFPSATHASLGDDNLSKAIERQVQQQLAQHFRQQLQHLLAKKAALPSSVSQELTSAVSTRLLGEKLRVSQADMLRILRRYAEVKAEFKATHKNFSIPFPQPSPQDDPADDAARFFLGYLAGFEATIGNLTACVNDGQYMVGFFEKGFDQLVEAMEEGNELLIQSALEQWAEGLMTMAGLMTTCGAFQFSKEVRYIVELMIDGDWVKMLILEVTNIGNNILTLIDDVQLAYYSFLIQDFWNAGIAVGHISGILLQL